MNKVAKIMTLVFFFGMLVTFPIITIFSHKETFSPEENRYLEELPEFSVDKIFEKSPGKKTYMQLLETYLSDHFIGRPKWISMKTKVDLLSGKKEIKDVFILKDKLVEEFNKPDYSLIDENIEYINEFARENGKEVYFMLAPTAYDIYSDQLPQYAPVNSEKECIDYIYSKLDNKITALDVYSSLFSARDEYIYYRTDHHWTSLGAYYAYAASIKKLGFSPVDLNSFDVEHASNDFQGTLYSKVLYNKNIPDDIIDYYHFRNGSKVSSVTVNNGIKKEKYPTMYFKDYLGKKDKYASFLGTNQPQVTIQTNAPGNKKILVIKDSYAHSFAPFLANHYSVIDLVDLRYFTAGLKDQINLNEYDQVLFLYNISNFVSDKELLKLNVQLYNK